MPSLTPQRFFLRKMPKQGKPPNLPPSKRVLYRVVDAAWTRPDFVRELLWRRQVYNNAVQSMRYVFREELRGSSSATVTELHKLCAEEVAEFDRALELNQRRNEERTEERDRQGVLRERQLRRDILAWIEQKCEENELDDEARTREVEELIARSHKFITAESLEERIEEALENAPSVYEFTIDLAGTKRYSPAPVKYQEGVPTRQTGRLYDQVQFAVTLRRRRGEGGAG